MFNFLKSVKRSEKITDQAQIKKDYKYWRMRTLYSMYIGYAVFYFTRKSFVYAMPDMINALHFTKADIGILGTVFYLTYGISKFISGMISDKSNPRYFMAVGLIITGVANIFFGMSSSIPMLICFWLINGFFQGWGWPPCARLLTHWFSQKERGTWWGIWNTSHNVGGGLIPIIVAFAVTWWGWRYGMFIPGAIAILVGLFLINRLRGVPEDMGLPPIEEYKNDYPNGKKCISERKISTKEILFKYVLNNKYMWLLAASYVFVYIVRTALNDWGALYLTHKGASLISADSCMSFFEVGGFCGSLIAGWCSDKIFGGKRGPMNVIYAIGIIFAVLAFYLAPGANFILHAIAVFMIGFLVFGPQMLIGTAAAELSHREAAGTATGFVGLFGYIGAALSGYPVAIVMQHGGWHAFFVTMAICSVISVLLLIPLWSVTSNPVYVEEACAEKDC